MNLKDETTVVKMITMNASDPVVGDLVKSLSQKKMRNSILKRLKKITPLQYDLMTASLIGISQSRKTLKAPSLISLKKAQYEKVLKHILKAAISFEHK